MKSVLLAAAVLAGLSAPTLARTIEERLIAGLKDQGAERRDSAALSDKVA